LLTCLLLSACATDATPGDDSTDGGGKSDSGSATRTITLAVDRRPVDGALVELHLEPRPGGLHAVVVDRTTLGRDGNQVYKRERLIALATCRLTLDAIACSDDDVAVDVVRNGETWDATLTAGYDVTALGTGMQVRHLRFSRDSAETRTLVELMIDTGVTTRTTKFDSTSGIPATRRLLDAVACTIDAGALSCIRDERPADGSLLELRAEPVAGAYRVTLRTSGLRLDGSSHDETETIAEALDLR
jgi:hypothetical protein